MSDVAAARPICDPHHWVSHYQPNLPTHWVRQCSLCGDFNAESMREEIARVADDLTALRASHHMIATDAALRAKPNAFVRFLTRWALAGSRGQATSALPWKGTDR